VVTADPITRCARCQAPFSPSHPSQRLCRRCKRRPAHTGELRTIGQEIGPDLAAQLLEAVKR
jgi:hypothetical protein